MRPLVLIESPYSGNVALHMEYLRACFRDALNRGEVPLATHKLYTDVLDDTIPEQRALGMSMLKELIEQTKLSAVYYDLGISPGMTQGVIYALSIGKHIDARSLYDHPVPRQFIDLTLGANI